MTVLGRAVHHLLEPNLDRCTHHQAMTGHQACPQNREDQKSVPSSQAAAAARLVLRRLTAFLVATVCSFDLLLAIKAGLSPG